MAKRIIRKNDDPVLYKVCKDVKKFDAKLSELIDDMIETMNDADGVGLAAPQIGILRRIAVIDVGDGPVELVNPVILDSSGEQGGMEGCLSFPGEAATSCVRTGSRLRRTIATAICTNTRARVSLRAPSFMRRIISTARCICAL